MSGTEDYLDGLLNSISEKDLDTKKKTGSETMQTASGPTDSMPPTIRISSNRPPRRSVRCDGSRSGGFSESAPMQVTARISTVMNGHAVHRPITTTPTTSERSFGATCSGGEAPLRWVATTSITTFSAPIWANRWPLRAAATSAKPNATWAICGCAIP